MGCQSTLLIFLKWVHPSSELAPCTENVCHRHLLESQSHRKSFGKGCGLGGGLGSVLAGSLPTLVPLWVCLWQGCISCGPPLGHLALGPSAQRVPGCLWLGVYVASLWPLIAHSAILFNTPQRHPLTDTHAQFCIVDVTVPQLLFVFWLSIFPTFTLFSWRVFIPFDFALACCLFWWYCCSLLLLSPSSLVSSHAEKQ